MILRNVFSFNRIIIDLSILTAYKIQLHQNLYMDVVMT